MCLTLELHALHAAAACTTGVTKGTIYIAWMSKPTTKLGTKVQLPELNKKTCQIKASCPDLYPDSSLESAALLCSPVLADCCFWGAWGPAQACITDVGCSMSQLVHQAAVM
jgi:hypothetical protein